MTGILVLIGFSALLGLLIWASHRVTSRRWRQCQYCGWYFNELGEVTARPPNMMNVGPEGVCPDCGADARYRQQ